MVVWVILILLMLNFFLTVNKYTFSFAVTFFLLVTNNVHYNI